MSDRRALVILAALSCALRVALVAVVPSQLWFAGGDGPWYVRQAWFLAHGGPPEPMRTVGPLYPLVLAALWSAFPGQSDPVDAVSVAAPFLISVRLLQAALGALTAVFVFSLARLLVGRRGALLAGAAVAVGPAFVIEPVLVHTETMFIALLVATVLLHVWNSRLRPGPAALVGGLAALAALTRPVLLLFPLTLTLQLLVAYRSKRARGAGVAVLVGAIVVLSPWHIWLHRATGSWLPAGFASNLWIGKQRDGGTLEVKTFHELEGQLEASGHGYVGGAFSRIAAEPCAWLRRRTSNLATSVLQPHGTSDLGGPSTKAEVVRWVREDRSVDGALRISLSRTFWIRLSIYLFHYAALILAVLGIWTTLPRWRQWSPVYATVLYFVAVHALLPATPRYLFPIEPFLWVLAGAAVGAAPVVTSGEDLR